MERGHTTKVPRRMRWSTEEKVGIGTSCDVLGWIKGAAERQLCRYCARSEPILNSAAGDVMVCREVSPDTPNLWVDVTPPPA
jgi:hypothetical protein